MKITYWDIGRQIEEKQENAKWGNKFIDQLGHDLCVEFPEMSGFSRANLFSIKKFYLYYQPLFENELSIVHQLCGLIENNKNAIVNKLG